LLPRLLSNSWNSPYLIYQYCTQLITPYILEYFNHLAFFLLIHRLFLLSILWWVSPIWSLSAGKLILWVIIQSLSDLSRFMTLSANCSLMIPTFLLPINLPL
jgi:hypothetical protein